MKNKNEINTLSLKNGVSLSDFYGIKKELRFSSDNH